MRKALLLMKAAMGLCLLVSQTARSQNSPTTFDKVISFPSRYVNKIQHKYSQVDEDLTKQTEKYLQRLAKREKKLQRKLSKIDSTAAQQLFANSEQQYAQLISR